MVELQWLVPEDRVEAVSDALIDELGALSVSVEDADADTSAEQALFGEPGMPAPRGGWQRSTLTALFENEGAATEAATLLLAQDWTAGVQLRGLSPVEDQDWVRLTQSQFEPVEIGTGFWIVPSWHEAPPAARRVIRLDPGLAFGTGTHPTTRMCLRWIARHADTEAAGWTRVLDYGCGSGILAIGAALHGAQAIDAVDIDPAAIESTRANAQANGVTLSAALPDAAHGVYPLILANILATPLKLLAPLLCGHLAPGGQLVLAGILERQADELTAAYAPHVELRVSDSDDGWILMTARATSPAPRLSAELAHEHSRPLAGPGASGEARMWPCLCGSGFSGSSCGRRTSFRSNRRRGLWEPASAAMRPSARNVRSYAAPGTLTAGARNAEHPGCVR